MVEPRSAPLLSLHRQAGAVPVEERDDESLMLLVAGGHRRAFEGSRRATSPR